MIGQDPEKHLGRVIGIGNWPFLLPFKQGTVQVIHLQVQIKLEIPIRDLVAKADLSF